MANHFLSLLISGCMIAGLTGCNSVPKADIPSQTPAQTPATNPQAMTAEQKAAALSLVPTSQARLAFEPVVGLPPEHSAAFARALAQAARERSVTISGLNDPTTTYRIKGHLTAEEGVNGSQLSYIWDVFDARTRQRVKRLTGATALSTDMLDPWASVDAAALQKAARESAALLSIWLGKGQAI